MWAAATTRTPASLGRGVLSAVSWSPLVFLVAIAAALGRILQPWVFMWLICIAIFAGLKWVTWWKTRARVPHAGWRSVAYLVAWPGMDAEGFLDGRRAGPAPGWRAWLAALLKTATGVALIGLVARRVPSSWELLQGWVGMVGLVLVLHFGVFELVALSWQSVGIEVVPIMDHPLRSTSLGEFWGSRWNLGFREFAHDLIFRPLQSVVGPGAAGFLVFVVSGLIHELAISLPARGGYGLPTLYFALQGAGVAVERSGVGKHLGLRRGVRGVLFTCAVTAGPLFLLFHPWFVRRVILPFLAQLGAGVGAV